MTGFSKRVAQLPTYPMAELPAIKRRLIEQGVDVIALGEHRKAIADNDLRRIVDRVRTPSAGASATTSAHVEAVGYGHGV